MLKLLITVAVFAAFAFAITINAAQPVRESDRESVAYTCVDDGLGPSCGFVCN